MISIVFIDPEMDREIWYDRKREIWHERYIEIGHERKREIRYERNIEIRYERKRDMVRDKERYCVFCMCYTCRHVLLSYPYHVQFCQVLK